MGVPSILKSLISLFKYISGFSTVKCHTGSEWSFGINVRGTGRGLLVLLHRALWNLYIFFTHQQMHFLLNL